jgi:hypothetical protein
MSIWLQGDAGGLFGAIWVEDDPFAIGGVSIAFNRCAL